MKKNDKIDVIEQNVDSRLSKTVERMAAKLYQDSLLARYKLFGYVVKNIAKSTVLEDPDKTGWYVEVYENRLDIYEEGLLKRRVGSDYECLWSYWPDGELMSQVWKDLTTGLITDKKKYTEEGELSEDTQNTRDSSGETVREYVQTFWHTEEKVDEKNGKLIKTTEFWNDLVDKNESLYKVTVMNERHVVLHERCMTKDDDICVTYGEHEKLGNVVTRIENCDFDIQSVYDKERIVLLIVTGKRFVGNPKKLIYLKETCKDRELTTDWEKVIEFVKKKKYKKVELKRHLYDFGNKTFSSKTDEILKRSVVLESVDLNSVEFVKGTLT